MTDTNGASGERRVRSLRVYTWWSLTLMSCCLLVPLLLHITTFGGEPSTWLLLLAVAVTSVQRTRLVNRVMHDHEHRRGATNELAISALGALAIWAFGAATQPAPFLWIVFPALLSGIVVINLPTRSRWRVAAALVLGTGVMGAAAFPLHPNENFHPLLLCALAMAVCTAFILIDIAQLWLWRVVVEVDRARATAGKLAVAHERLRFAHDLHDVQGHHLQAIVLKGELAQRLVGHDDNAARAQANEVTELAREALTRTRETVHGYRNTDLYTETTNATELLHAAGIHTTVEGKVSAVPPPLQQLFGTLVREGTTNVLRHSAAQHCHLVFATTSEHATVRLSNDGVRAGGDEAGNGITGLRERFATLGGQLTADIRADGHFELSGQAPQTPRSKA